MNKYLITKYIISLLTKKNSTLWARNGHGNGNFSCPHGLFILLFFSFSKGLWDKPDHLVEFPWSSCGLGRGVNKGRVDLCVSVGLVGSGSIFDMWSLVPPLLMLCSWLTPGVLVFLKVPNHSRPLRDMPMKGKADQFCPSMKKRVILVFPVIRYSCESWTVKKAEY